MATRQGDLALLNDPLARQLMRAAIPARLACTARDGTPRAIPVLFHWDGADIVIGTWPEAAKVMALQKQPDVAVTIDNETPPFRALMLRGRARVEIVDGVPDGYAKAAERYMVDARGKAWAAHIAQVFPRMARIAVRPTWVGLLDFETRFPSGLARAMGVAGSMASAASVALLIT